MKKKKKGPKWLRFVVKGKLRRIAREKAGIEEEHRRSIEASDRALVALLADNPLLASIIDSVGQGQGPEGKTDGNTERSLHEFLGRVRNTRRLKLKHPGLIGG